MSKWYTGMPSPNPGGRPKSILRVAELAREHTEAAVKTLVEIMGDTKAPKAARVSAATEILNRGYGRAPQNITVDVDLEKDTAIALTPFDRAQRIAFALSRGLVEMKQGALAAPLGNGSIDSRDDEQDGAHE